MVGLHSSKYKYMGPLDITWIPYSQTRAATLHTQENPKMRDELIESSTSTIKNQTQARTFLDRQGLIAKEDPISIEGLSFVLLSLTHSATTKILQDRARAVAILITDESAKTVGNEVMRYVKKKLTPVLNKLEESTKSMSNTTVRELVSW